MYKQHSVRVPHRVLASTLYGCGERLLTATRGTTEPNTQARDVVRLYSAFTCFH